MRVERYYASENLSVNAFICLDAEQSKHCLKVMRNKVGDIVIIFNGLGGEYQAEIVSTEKKRVQLRVIEFLNIERELLFDVSLFVPVSSPKRFDFLVEKSVELGVKEIIPLITERTIRCSDDFSVSAISRLNKKIIESCKQCRRNTLAKFKNPLTVAELLKLEFDKKFYLHTTAQKFDFSGFSQSSSIALAVGPEGGFTDAEVQDFQSNGWIVWFLGAKILRVETAGIAVLAVLNQISTNLL